jgi:hypothetical protein
MGQNRRPTTFLLKKAEHLIETLSSMLRSLTRHWLSVPGPISTDCVAGNFLMGDFFGAVRCRHGHPVRLFNIGGGHFVACDECRTYIFVGSNLMSTWRQETEDVWRRNSDSVEGYGFIEWGPSASGT